MSVELRRRIAVASASAMFVLGLGCSWDTRPLERERDAARGDLATARQEASDARRQTPALRAKQQQLADELATLDEELANTQSELLTFPPARRGDLLTRLQQYRTQVVDAGATTDLATKEAKAAELRASVDVLKRQVDALRNTPRL